MSLLTTEQQNVLTSIASKLFLEFAPYGLTITVKVVQRKIPTILLEDGQGDSVGRFRIVPTDLTSDQEHDLFLDAKEFLQENSAY